MPFEQEQRLRTVAVENRPDAAYASSPSTVFAGHATIDHRKALRRMVRVQADVRRRSG